MTYLMRATTAPDGELKEKFLDCLGAKDEWHLVWPLPNMKEITEYKYWHAHTSYSDKISAYAGRVKHEGAHCTLLLYFNDIGRHQLGGYAVLHHYGWPEEEGWVKYFEWYKCDHEWQPKNIGNCLNRYTCKHGCGSVYDVDSSG